MAKDSRFALKIVPIYSLNAIASVVCSMATDIVKVVTGDQRRRYRLMREYSEDDRAYTRAILIKEAINRYFDKLCEYLSYMENIFMTSESLGASNDEAVRIALPHVDAVRQTLIGEMAECRPMEPRLFFDIVNLLYFSSIFINYRQSFNKELDDWSKGVFRSLDIDKLIRQLANDLQMEDRDGKVIRFVYDANEEKLWKSLAGRRSYKGIDVQRQNIVPLRRYYASETIDRVAFGFIKDLFSYASLDRIVEAGGQDFKFSKMFKSGSFFGSMYTYEQYALSVAMRSRNLTAALRWFEAVKQMGDIGAMYCVYDNSKGHGEFKGMYKDVYEASRETATSVEEIVRNAEYNGVLRDGPMIVRVDRNKNAFFKATALEALLDNLKLRSNV